MEESRLQVKLISLSRGSIASDFIRNARQDIGF